MNDKKDGYGAYIRLKVKNGVTIGDMLIGEWGDDYMDNFGEHFNTKGLEYRGGWKKTRYQGWGFLDVKDYCVYEGQFEHGKKAGNGHTVFGNGDTFDGMYVNDVMCGQGKYSWKSQSKSYDGQWLNDTMNGFGVMNMGDGSLFSGNFLRGLRHGACEWRWRDGRKWVGEYFKGIKQHEGHTVLCSGKRAKGNRGERQNSIFDSTSSRINTLGDRVNNWRVSIIPTSKRLVPIYD